MSTERNSVVLSIEDISVHFGGLMALDKVSFEVNEAELVSIIGPNGAGKTTLFNTIAGVVTPSSGCVRLAGESTLGMGPARMSYAGVRRTFQVAEPFGSMSVAENVRLSLATRDVLLSWRALKPRRRDSERAARLEELLDMTSLTRQAAVTASDLDVGALRRLEVARALAGDPRVLLLDEPAAGIGVDGVAPLAELIKKVNGSGVAILLVEHLVGFALSLADRVVVLDAGQVIALGPPQAVRHDERVIAAYLGGAHGN